MTVDLRYFFKLALAKAFFRGSLPHLRKELQTERTKRRDGYFGLNDLDKKLEKYLDYDDGFYVELGANDGVTQSNTFYFELKRYWRGVLIEPSPHNYIRCRQARGAKNAVFCNACVPFGYAQKYVDIAYANLMSVSESLAIDLDSTDDHLKSGQQHLPQGEDVFRFGALAAPLSALLDTAHAPKVIDLLSLDVEGAELEVLKGVDFQRHRFKFLLIESRKIDVISDYLSAKGYRLIDQLSHHDHLFTSEPPDA